MFNDKADNRALSLLNSQLQDLGDELSKAIDRADHQSVITYRHQREALLMLYYNIRVSECT